MKWTEPVKTFRAGKCWAEVELTHDMTLYLEMDRTPDGEMTLLKASYILDGGAQVNAYGEVGRADRSPADTLQHCACACPRLRGWLANYQ